MLQVFLQVQVDICKQQPLFGVKICSDICLQTLHVPRSEQFSENVAWGNCEPERTNIRAYFCPKWRLLCLVSFSYFFCNKCTFWKSGNITRICPRFSWGIFSHMKHLDQSCMSGNISQVKNVDTHETDAWKHNATAVNPLHDISTPQSQHNFKKKKKRYHHFWLVV